MLYLAIKIASFVISLGGFAAIYLLLRPVVNGAVYFPTTTDNIKKIKMLAAAKQGSKVVDLGSGDGRVVMAFAEDGIETHGYEINPLLVRSSRKKIADAGLTNKAKIYWKSFWRKDLSSYDTVIIYGIPYIMPSLGKKLRRELKPGSKVIANIYGFPNWKEQTRKSGVYLYVV